MSELFAVIWILCGFIHYGLAVGHNQIEYPIIAEDDKIRDRVFAGFSALFGPIALLTTIIVFHPYHWKL